MVRDSNVKDELAGTLSSGNPATDAIRIAPAVIVVCAELKKSGCSQGEPVTDKSDSWHMFDVALAMQNLTSAAHSLGLGTVRIGAFDAEKAASILEIPEGFCVVEMTPLGYPDQEGRATSRKELPEIVFHEKFGN